MYSGLNSSDAEKLLGQIGPNEIPQKEVGALFKILKNSLSPISAMLLLASLMSFLIGKEFDGYFILALLVLNAVITLWQEDKADNSIKELNEHLVQKIKVLRNGVWDYIDSRFLVPGDTVQLTQGEVIPADGKVLEASSASANESALTGESLPKDKNPNDLIYSGSFLAAGIIIAEITATGAATNFGKTLFSVETIRKKSLLEKDIVNISKFLTILSLLAVVVLTIVFIFEKVSYPELLTLDLSLIIAGIPISLPTVMTLIIEFGVLNLAKKKAVVRRLSALEDLANVNLLLTDKTGTLTNNKIAVQDIYSYGDFNHSDVLSYAAITSSLEGDNPIDQAIKDKVQTLQVALPVFTKVDFKPFDSKRKRSTVTIKNGEERMIVSVGAPQVIESLCLLDIQTKEKFQREVTTLASDGYRTLAVATGGKFGEEEMQLVGLLALSDELRPEAKAVVRFLEDNGIGVTMVTGDNGAIAYQIAHQLSLGNRKVITGQELNNLDWNKIREGYFSGVGAFAEILPEDKLNLVQKAKQFFVVAVNGDGINDLPAVRAANVGIAVKNAVAALKATADIVLLSEGIGVIKDAVIESRKIFERIYTYSLYRISESFRLIVTITVLGILYRVYPLTPLQIILIALLNDIPIISLAFDRVGATNRPEKIEVRQRFVLSSLYGSVGVLNSLLLFLLVKNVWRLDWNIIQTMFFLKLTVSGHLLIYVAHTQKRWFRFLPSREVIWATTLTQLTATLLVLTGFLMPGRLSIFQVIFVWGWALFWMQISEAAKVLQAKLAG